MGRAGTSVLPSGVFHNPFTVRIWTPPGLQANSEIARVRLHTYIRPVNELYKLWPLWVIRASRPDRPDELKALRTVKVFKMPVRPVCHVLAVCFAIVVEGVSAGFAG